MNDFTLETDARGVSTLTLNRADKHNAFDDALIAGLTAALQGLADSTQTRVLILAARGKSFCAGADLGWMQHMAAYSEIENLADAEALATLMHTLDTLPVPTIARVQGAAFGGGVGLVACCDMALATARASFCLSEVKLGLTPATISPYVVRAMGARACRRYFQSAERFTASTAMTLGLLSDVLDDESSLDEAVNTLCDMLLANGPVAMREAKRLIDDVAGQPIDDALRKETSRRIATQRISPEGQEGLGAFFDKRPPAWQDASKESSS